MPDLDRSTGMLYKGAPPPPSEAVGKAAFYLQKDVDVVSTKTKAQLRRLDPSNPVSPSVHRMLVRLGQEDSEDWISQERWERRWGIVLHVAALCGDLHDYDVPLGHSLAKNSVSETRLTALLEAKSNRLFQIVAHQARRLSKGSTPANLDQVRLLVFRQSGEAGDRIRTRISRPFYRTLSHEAVEQT